MEFEYLEFRWGEYVGDRARRLSSWLVENGYQSLQEEWRETAQRYLPLPASPAPGAPQEARTADVLIPPADPASRILVCERPGDGHTVAVLAVGRTAKDARRHHTAVKLVLDAKAPLDEAWRGHRLEENGRDHARRFQEEWLPASGWCRRSGAALPARGSRARSRRPRPSSPSREPPPSWAGPPSSGAGRPGPPSTPASSTASRERGWWRRPSSWCAGAPGTSWASARSPGKSTRRCSSRSSVPTAGAPSGRRPTTCSTA